MLESVAYLLPGLFVCWLVGRSVCRYFLHVHAPIVALVFLKVLNLIRKITKKVGFKFIYEFSIVVYAMNSIGG